MSIHASYFCNFLVCLVFVFVSVKAQETYDKGEVEAHFRLGVMYDQGQSMQQDDKKAVVFYTKAAEQGHAGAQSNLGLMYNSGQGVPQDYKEAYVWFNISAAQGNKYAHENRGILAPKLDPQTLEQAQELSKEYYKKYVEPFAK